MPLSEPLPRSMSDPSLVVRKDRNPAVGDPSAFSGRSVRRFVVSKWSTRCIKAGRFRGGRMVVGEEGADVEAFRLVEVGSGKGGTAEKDTGAGLGDAPPISRGAANSDFTDLPGLVNLK